MDAFKEVYQSLNDAQREAVDHTEGPMLVIAGPGTGKTQLLSARVANILRTTDTPASNILCLTFTDNGAQNMRDRLTRFIGQAAYDVQINTYHAFGGELIRRYSEYFAETRLQNPIDELSRRQVVAQIIENLEYQNPLRQTRHHLEDLISTMSEIKRAMLKPDGLRRISEQNLYFITHASHAITKLLNTFSRMPKYDAAVSLFEQVLLIISVYTEKANLVDHITPLAAVAHRDLLLALQQSSESRSTAALTKWKNAWLARDGDNKMILAGENESRRIHHLADALDRYTDELTLQGLYDFDDMIVKAVEVLKTNDDLRYTLQERYLYVLLDEYQDTNAAQASLVHLLTNNPVHEGRPNIMAVGDDDQAIYAFQGALYSNMLDFFTAYSDVRVINLTENYRSSPDILYTAGHIASQIQERLFTNFDGASKNLQAANSADQQQMSISRYEFKSEIAQNHWIAQQIRELIDAGVAPTEIAIIAPRHRYLEPIVPYLNALRIPVRYEKRENILDTEIIKQLVVMSRLVIAIHRGENAIADHLWPQVLSFDFWHLPIGRIWELSWKIADDRQLNTHLSWSKALLTERGAFQKPAILMMTLASKVDMETCETMMDYLIGSAYLDTNEIDIPRVLSPLRDFYVGENAMKDKPDLFYQSITYLTVLRARFREHQASRDGVCSLTDLIEYIDMYEAAGERMLNTSPYSQDDQSVQLLTVYKAKGLEFGYVFLPNSQDDVWGSTSRSQSNHLSLPANLIPIRHAGVTDDERLRLLYVAVTRAKQGLHITSFKQTYGGKPTRRLKYLDEREDSNGEIRDYVLPPSSQLVHYDDTSPPAIELLEQDWRQRHHTGIAQASLRSLMRHRLLKYRLSPTHLSTFLDLEYGGPQKFFFSVILRFPEAPLPDGEFGNAIHETLEWLQLTLSSRKSLPPIGEALAYFAERMTHKKLMPSVIQSEITRGQVALAAFLENRSLMYSPDDRAEVGFSRESLRVDNVQLSGKIDRLEIDHKNRTITVVDYKTGKSYSKWLSNPTLHKYKRQLYCYKILVDASPLFRGYAVRKGRLEFVEPDMHNRINSLSLTFDELEVIRVKKLMDAIWKHVHMLSFPKVSEYQPNLQGIKQFESDLISDSI